MASKNFPYLIETQAKKYKDKIVLYDRKRLSDSWQGISWKAMNDEVESLAKAFLELGINEQENVAQFSQNKSQNLIIDFALFSVRAVMVPIYPTSTVQQVDFIISDASIRYLFVGDQRQYDVAIEVMKESNSLKKLIAIDSSIVFSDAAHSIYYDELLEMGHLSAKKPEIDKLRSKVEDKDLACILYTSGTTGNSKGVMMTYEMLHEAMRIHAIRLRSLTDKDVSLSFLPLTHVFERAWCYFLLFSGCSIYINQNPTEIQQTIKDVKPSLMCAVPRFWEKVFIGIKEVLDNYSPLMMGVVAWAIETGKKRNLKNLSIGKKPNQWLEFRYRMADALVFSKVKKTLGFENAHILPVAGAKLSDEITTFFRSIGFPLVYGYGLTESTATVTCFDNVYEIGTVGTIMPDVQVKIGDENEILLKGKTITPGYYKNEEANKTAFTSDGWFRTGDAGKIKNNQLILTERLKDLFKTSNGKYIAPQEIETRLGTDKYIEQVAVIADEKNYVTAIIAPVVSELENYAKSISLPYDSIGDLLEKPEIYQLIEEQIAEKQAGMANYELIKKFTLIKIPFSIETGELTNTLKIRRAVIMQKYKSEIEAMYSSSKK